MSTNREQEQRQRQRKREGDNEQLQRQERGEASELDNLRTIFDPSTLVRKGLCPVTTLRGQEDDPLESHSLYFEMHGRGPEKVVFIMGYVYKTVRFIVFLYSEHESFFVYEAKCLYG